LEQKAMSVMGTFDALDKAKKAAELASQTALGVKDHASGLAAGARDQAAATVGGLKDLLVEKIADVKDAATSGVKEMVEGLSLHLPALGEAGYTLGEVSVELGIPPKVIATFASQPDITQERVDAVIAEHREAKVTIAILRALFTASRLQNGIKIAGMTPRGIALELGLVPSVIVKFA
jgi:hypothetical protein